MSNNINKPLDNKFYNLDLIVLNDDVKRRFREVKVSTIFEPSSSTFDQNGLFSTNIFGPLGSATRNETLGFIDMKIGCLHPIPYNDMISLRSLYKDIAEGKKYAKFDNKLGDFVEDVSGETGYDFLVKNIKKVKFDQRDGNGQRDFKIKMIEKYGGNDAYNTGWFVLPAGLRDYTVDDSGNPSEDPVNPMYRKLMSISSMLNNIKIDDSNIMYLNNIRLKEQKTINEIYMYFFDLLKGKSKFQEGKYAKRAITYGTRNVATPYNMTLDDLDNLNGISSNHTIIGLYQFVSGIFPVVVYRVQNMFINSVLSPDTDMARLINPETMKSELVRINVNKRNEWLTKEGLEGIVEKLKQDELRIEPVRIDKYYLGLIYDDGKNVEYIQDTDNLGDLDPKYLRPITYAELFYISVYQVRDKYPGFVTRYPVANHGNIYPSYTYLKTTHNSRTVNFKMGFQTGTLKEYPILDELFFNSTSPHYKHAARLDLDYDGDTVSYNIIMTRDGIEEVKNYINSLEFYISPVGDFYYSMNTAVTRLTTQHLLITEDDE